MAHEVGFERPTRKYSRLGRVRGGALRQCLQSKLVVERSETYAPYFLPCRARFITHCERVEPHDLRVMRSYIDLGSVIDVLDRTGVAITKPSISP